MIFLINFIVSIALGLVCFISTENIISSCVIFLITLLYFLIYANRIIKQKDEKISRFTSCYQFINNFLIALSIKGHVSGALASALESQNDETNDLIKSVDSNDPMEKLNYFKEFYKFDVYSLFVDLVCLFNDEGGDIIQMSHYLLNQIREDEEYLINAERMNKKSLIEFTILWMFSLSILLILRFSLDDLFLKIIKSLIYQTSVVCVLLFAIFSVHITVRKITNLKIKGWE